MLRTKMHPKLLRLTVRNTNHSPYHTHFSSSKQVETFRMQGLVQLCRFVGNFLNMESVLYFDYHFIL